jgi:hypothetical protein
MPDMFLTGNGGRSQRGANFEFLLRHEAGLILEDDDGFAHTAAILLP